MAAHSAAAPPDPSGSLSPSTTLHDADWPLGDAMAQAPPDKDAAITSSTGAGMIRQIRCISPALKLFHRQNQINSVI
jgi:hypothetical protein